MDTPLTFNTVPNETVGRKMMILYLNTATSGSPSWSAIGKRVEDSAMEMDWGGETKNDILGSTYTSFNKPIITQTFDPCELDAADPAQVMLWNIAIKDQNYAALANLDLLVVHTYAGTVASPFADRWPASAIAPSSIGGPGGGALGMPLDVTFGGKRTTGTATVDNAGVVTYTEG